MREETRTDGFAELHLIVSFIIEHLLCFFLDPPAFIRSYTSKSNPVRHDHRHQEDDESVSPERLNVFFADAKMKLIIKRHNKWHKDAECYQPIESSRTASPLNWHISADRTVCDLHRSFFWKERVAAAKIEFNRIYNLLDLSRR